MRTPTPFRDALVIAALAVVSAVAITFLKKPAATPSLEALAAFVESHGTPHLMYPAIAKFFGLPGDDGQLIGCSAVSDSSRTRSIDVRRRTHSSIVDILLVDEQPGGNAACFYQTTDAGKLLNSVYLDTEPKPIDDANKRFENEKGFWLNWLREKLKHEAK